MSTRKELKDFVMAATFSGLNTIILTDVYKNVEIDQLKSYIVEDVALDVAAATASIANLNSYIQDALLEVNTSIDVIEGNLSSATASIANLNTNLASATASIAILNTNLASATASIANLDNGLSTAFGELDLRIE